MTDKAPEAFRTISEVAEELALPQHVLRFWETRFAQIRPLKRGGGRRYYRPEDIDLLRGIRHLLYEEGYTIKGVQRILKERGVRQVAAGRKAAQTPQSPAAGPAPPIAAAPPQPTEREPAAPAQPAERPPAAPAPRRSEAERRALEAVLNELRACRDLLNAAREDS